MLALTTMSSLAVLLTTPFSADEGEFIHALRSGEIQSVALGHSADFRSTSGFSTTAFNAQDDIAVSWVNRFGFRRMAVLDQLQGLSQSTKSTPAPASRTLGWIHRPQLSGRHRVSARSLPPWPHLAPFALTGSSGCLCWSRSS